MTLEPDNTLAAPELEPEASPEETSPEKTGFMTRLGRGSFWLALFALLAAALLLRSVGLGRDFPYAIHCDTAKQLVVIKKQLEGGGAGSVPLGYPVGHQQVAYWVLNGASSMAEWMGMDGHIKDQTIFLAGRINIIFFGLLGVIFVTLAGRRLFGPYIGLLAGLMFSMDEFFIIHSHWAMGDIPQAAMAAGALYFSSRIMDENRLSDSIWAGVCVGMAAAIKYYGGYMVAVFILAHFLTPRKNWGGLLAGLVACAAGFAVLTPALIVDPETWLARVLHEVGRETGRTSMLKGGGVTAFISGLGVSFGMQMKDSLIFPWLILPAIALLFIKHTRKDWLLLIALGGAMAIINVIRVVHLKPWDQVILIPFYCLAIARGAQIAWGMLPHTVRPLFSLANLARPGFIILGSLLLLGQVYYSLEQAYLLALPDTRKQLEAWLEDNLPPAREGQTLILDETVGDATKILTTTTYYNEKKGYRLEQIGVRNPARGKAELSSPKAKSAGLVVLHSIHGSKVMSWYDRKVGPAKTFALLPETWHNPTIHVYDPNRVSLPYGWRPLSVTPAAWPLLVRAETPFSRRQVRETTLKGGEQKEFVIISPEPLSVLALAVTGDHRVEAEHGLDEKSIFALADRPGLIVFEPQRGFPYRFNTYRIRVKADKGPALVRLVISKAELAFARYRAGEKEKARILWQKCLDDGKPVLPLDRVILAGLYADKGDEAKARSILKTVEKQHPELPSALAALLSNKETDPKAAAETLAPALGLRPELLYWRDYGVNMADSRDTPGKSITGYKGRKKVLWLPKGSKGFSKLWRRDLLAGSDLMIRFWLKASPGPEEHLATVDVYGHRGGHPIGVLASAEVITAGGDGFFPVDLRLKNARVPLWLEMRINSGGKRDIWAAEVEVLPDIAAWVGKNLSPAVKLLGAEKPDQTPLDQNPSPAAPEGAAPAGSAPGNAG